MSSAKLSSSSSSRLRRKTIHAHESGSASIPARIVLPPPGFHRRGPVVMTNNKDVVGIVERSPPPPPHNATSVATTSYVGPIMESSSSLKTTPASTVSKSTSTTNTTAAATTATMAATNKKSNIIAVDFAGTTSPPEESRKTKKQPPLAAAAAAPSTVTTRREEVVGKKSVMPLSERQELISKLKELSLKDETSNAQSSSPTSASNNIKHNLYKTELCRGYEEEGSCRYGSKCQFAHGMSELRPVQRHPKYKTEICKTFWERGECPYGKRCCFVHNEVEKLQPSAAAALYESLMRSRKVLGADNVPSPVNTLSLTSTRVSTPTEPFGFNYQHNSSIPPLTPLANNSTLAQSPLVSGVSALGMMGGVGRGGGGNPLFDLNNIPLLELEKSLYSPSRHTTMPGSTASLGAGDSYLEWLPRSMVGSGVNRKNSMATSPLLHALFSSGASVTSGSKYSAVPPPLQFPTATTTVSQQQPPPVRTNLDNLISEVMPVCLGDRLRLTQRQIVLFLILKTNNAESWNVLQRTSQIEKDQA